MAVTKIKPIRGTVNKALAYILDPQKTDDAFYVSSYGCAASDAAAKEFEWTRNLAVQQGMQMPKVLARHLIQSFDIGEVTPEEAHAVGKQLADEWLKGKYEYVIATHIDKGHCHNHIIFNAVNYVDFHAYRSNKRTYRELRQLSDEICKEHGLSVIPPSQNKGMDYKRSGTGEPGANAVRAGSKSSSRPLTGLSSQRRTTMTFCGSCRKPVMKSRPANTSPSALKVRSDLPGLKPSERTTQRNASRSGSPDGRRAEVRDRSRRKASPLSEIFRSGSGSSTAKAMSIPQAIQ